jgi:mRNA-degrading endonuclease RelE of RelBE toxin-antitoxin system
MSTLKEIRKLEEKRSQALDNILSIKLMVPGSYNEVYCRCGKSNCWCSSGKGHPFRRITFSEDGKPKTTVNSGKARGRSGNIRSV